MFRKQILIALSCCSLLAFPTFAQNSEQYGSGLKLNLNPEGNKYVRFLVWSQIWARYNQNNPGTLVNGSPSQSSMDFGARRLRLLTYAQISPRYMIVTHFGINNQTFTNGGGSGSTGTGGYGQGKKPQLFFHDAFRLIAHGQVGKYVYPKQVDRVFCYHAQCIGAAGAIGLVVKTRTDIEYPFAAEIGTYAVRQEVALLVEKLVVYITRIRCFRLAVIVYGNIGAVFGNEVGGKGFVDAELVMQFCGIAFDKEAELPWAISRKAWPLPLTAFITTTISAPITCVPAVR